MNIFKKIFGTSASEFSIGLGANRIRLINNSKALELKDIDNTPVTLAKSFVGLGNVTNDAQLKASDLDTDGTLAANSDTKIPSQKAVKGYVEGYAKKGGIIESDFTTASQSYVDITNLGANVDTNTLYHVVASIKISIASSIDYYSLLLSMPSGATVQGIYSENNTNVKVATTTSPITLNLFSRIYQFNFFIKTSSSSGIIKLQTKSINNGDGGKTVTVESGACIAIDRIFQ